MLSNVHIGPAVEKALRFLIYNLDKATWTVGQSLPPLKSLAQAAGVSTLSMWRGVQILKNQQKLWVVKGGRIKVGHPTSYSVATSGESRRWAKLKQHIYHEVISGIYAAGDSMPSLKELRIRYGASFPTLKKALQQLVAERVIIPYKKSYMVPRYSKSTLASSIVFLCSTGLSGHLENFGYRMKECIDMLEKQCHIASIRLEVCGFSVNNTFTRKEIIKKTATSLGSIFWIGDWFNEDNRSAALSFIYEIARRGKPLAVFDEIGVLNHLPQQFPTTRNLQLFTIAARKAAEEVGRMLIRLGHRRIAYISPHFKHCWAVKRHQGLNKAFNSAGLPNAVSAFTLDQMYNSLDIALAVCNFDENNINMLRQLNIPENHIELTMQKSDILCNFSTIFPATRQKIEQIKQYFSIIFEIKQRCLDPKVFAEISSALISTAADKGLEVYLQPLFEQALSDKTISAWVCDCDAVAYRAMMFLANKNISVPRDISLVGFDNTEDSLNKGITTYNFNFSGIARRMLDFILKPELQHFSSTPVEIEGILIERGTTARPRTEAPN